MKDSDATWSAVRAVGDENFDCTSSLTEALWGVFKFQLSRPLSNLLLVSDVWRVSDTAKMELCCDLISQVYPSRLMYSKMGDTLVQIPFGFRISKQPLGRLLCRYDKHYANNVENRHDDPTTWLLNRIKISEDDVGEMKENYFLDWGLLRMPAHLSDAVGMLPLNCLRTIIDELFSRPGKFFEEWVANEAEVIAALEIVSIAAFAVSDFKWADEKMRNWDELKQSAVDLAITALSNPKVPKTVGFIQAIASIEVSQPLLNLVGRFDNLSNLWLGLRITKRMLLFDPNCKVKLPELVGISAEKLISNVTTLVIDSVIWPRFKTEKRRVGYRDELFALLKSTGSCASPDELVKMLRECPKTKRPVTQSDLNAANCPSCKVDLGPGHLVEPKQQDVANLFQDYQKFMFFFERVAELFIRHKGDDPRHIRQFVDQLLANRNLQVSWRFMTVIVKNILAADDGRNILDSVLLQIDCNDPPNLPPNARSLFQALIVVGDELTEEVV